MAPSTFPWLIILFSGKRKSGKDYIAEKLHEKLGPENSVIIRLSGPIKACWAEMKGLNPEDLMTSGSFKEEHRLEMIEWSEQLRSSNPGVFCKEATEMYNAKGKPFWIVSDARRKSDIKWFQYNYGEGIPCYPIRINATDEVRKSRGWIFQHGVDDAPSECGLDDYPFPEKGFDNNNSKDAEKIINFLMDKSIMLAS